MKNDVVFRLVQAGDSALTVEFEDRIDPEINMRSIALAEAVRAAHVAGVRDLVPTYRSVTIYFDPLRTEYDALVARVEREAGIPVLPSTDQVAPLTVPVCYGGEFGPDLAGVAVFAGMSERDVVRLHTKRTYRVFMLGFIPGFAYLGTVDDRIAVPRHSTPRARVAAGSVGIAGGQTGIYPTETPAGWQIIGRTRFTPFDARRREPFLIKPGDSVRFQSIDRAEYDRRRPSG